MKVGTPGEVYVLEREKTNGVSRQSSQDRRGGVVAVAGKASGNGVAAALLAGGRVRNRERTSDAERNFQCENEGGKVVMHGGGERGQRGHTGESRREPVSPVEKHQHAKVKTQEGWKGLRIPREGHLPRERRAQRGSRSENTGGASRKSGHA